MFDLPPPTQRNQTFTFAWIYPPHTAGKGLPSAPAGTRCPCPCVCPHLTHGQCWSHTDSQGCTMQPNLHSVRLVVDLWRGQTLSLVSGAPLPTLGMGKGQLWHPQASSLPCPSQGTEPFLAPLILWTFSCGWKGVGGAGGSSVASQGVLEVLYWGFFPHGCS